MLFPGSKWNTSNVRVLPIQVVPKTMKEFGYDPVKLIFVVAGESATAINIDQAKLMVRQVLANAHLQDLLGTPFQWTSHEGPTGIPVPVLQADETLFVASSVILAYMSIEERDNALELMRKFWAFILRE